jgi:hypothetical protein
MLVAGLRRFAVLTAVVVALAAAVGLAGALLLHAPLRRSLSVTFYATGGLLLVSGFFHGIRPPIRIDDEAGIPSVFGILLTRGRLRTASLDERHEALSSSGLFVSLAVVLIVLGALIDPIHRLV